MQLKLPRIVATTLTLAALLVQCPHLASSLPAASEFKVPVEYYKLPNGLRVALSPDSISQTTSRSFLPTNWRPRSGPKLTG